LQPAAGLQGVFRGAYGLLSEDALRAMHRKPLVAGSHQSPRVQHGALTGPKLN